MRSRKPSIAPDEITSILFSTARDMGLSGYDTSTGWGLLDAYAAVAAVRSPCPGDLDGNEVVDGGDLTGLLAGWGTDGSGDLDDSGSTDGLDIAVLLSAWGPCPD